MKYRLTFVLVAILAILSIGLSIAQTTCPALVEQALQAVSDNCENLPRNNACYGYNSVSAEFSQPIEDDFFVTPADTTELGIMESIQTAEMNTMLDQWGVAVMSLQANIPNSIPGQAIKFVLLGDVEVESDQNPEAIDADLDPITATVINDANIRSAPTQNANVLGGVGAGQAIELDGQSSDGQWYRTVITNRVGWIFIDLIEAADNLASLPVIDNERRSLMQAFYLRSGIGTPDCEEAPRDTLVIQGPQGIEVDFTINGADIRIGSTITARTLSPGNILELSVIDGTLTIPGAGPDGTDLVFFKNERTTACLSEPDDLGADGAGNDRLVNCDWSAAELISDTTLADDLCALEGIPQTLLNYAIDLDCPAEDPVPIVNDNQSSNLPLPTATDSTPDSEPTQDVNLCAEGNMWGDGRCRTEYDWVAGFYYGRLKAGEINLSDIPAPYYVTPTPAPANDNDSSSNNGISTNFGCGPSINEYEVTVNSGVSGDISFTATYTDSFTGVGSTIGPSSIPGTLNFLLPISSTAQNVSVTTSPSNTSKNLGNRDCN